MRITLRSICAVLQYQNSLRRRRVITHKTANGDLFRKDGDFKLICTMGDVAVPMSLRLGPELKTLRHSSFPSPGKVALKPSLPATRAARKVAAMLALADIRINGNRPWDIRVYDDRLYQRVLSQGSIGAGESYMDGWWDVAELDQFLTRIQQIDPYDKVGRWGVLWLALQGRIFNRQAKSRAGEVRAWVPQG